MPELKALKKKFRERIHVALRAEAASANPNAGAMVRDHFLKHFKNLKPGLVVSGTSPIKQELDPRPLMQVLAEKGMRLCLPVIGLPGEALIFRAYKPGEPLIPGQWGIGAPQTGKEELVPDLLLCPLLAFDRAGRRLGYGGGYYDITLKNLREKKSIQAFGLAYAVQEVEEVPVGQFDQKLDAIVTEKEVILPS